MSATLASSGWPAAPARLRSIGWRFAREIALSAAPGAARALQWRLARTEVLTPDRLRASYVLLCAVSLSLGFVLWRSGANWVLPITAIELALLGLAFGVAARHASDCETLTLVGPALLFERAIGSRREQAAFSAEWLTVEPVAGQNSLVQLAARGRTVRVGRFLRPELRADFARELRLAVRQAGAFPHHDKNRTKIKP